MERTRPTSAGIIDPTLIKPHLLYSTVQAAKLLNVSVNSVRYMVWSGRLKGRKVGRRTYITGKELLRFLGEPVVEPPSEGEE